METVRSIRLRYSPRSIEDLGNIRQHITKENPKAAWVVASFIRQSIDILKKWPYHGRAAGCPCETITSALTFAASEWAATWCVNRVSAARVIEDSVERCLARGSAEATEAGVPCATLSKKSEQPWKAIIDAAASERCDLIIMASHGRAGFDAVLLGSETQKVLTHTKIPVLVHR